MTPLFALFFFLLTQLTIEQELAEKYCPAETNLKPSCPRCGSYHTIKNGSVHNGKPKNQCKNCGRQFVIHLTQKTVSDDTKNLIDKLLLERISLRGIVRVTRVSWSWWQDYVNNKVISVMTDKSNKSDRRFIGKLLALCHQVALNLIHFIKKCKLCHSNKESGKIGRS